MNTTNSNNEVSRISSKARWARMAAIVALAGLGMTAPLASAAPLGAASPVIVLKDPIKLNPDALPLQFNGPDVITIKANEAHLLSEYFSISWTTLPSGATIITAGAVHLFPGDKTAVGFLPGTASADVLSSSLKISGTGSITIITSDGADNVTRTAAVLVAPAATAPTTTTTTTTTTAPTTTTTTTTAPVIVTPAPPVVTTAPPVLATTPVATTPVSTTPVATTVPPVATTAPPVAVAAPAAPPVPGAPNVAANRAPLASPMSVVAARDAATPFVLQGSDPDGSPISFALAQLPQHGKLTGHAPNLAYLADTGFVGVDAFTFTVNDGKDTSTPATVSLTATGSTKIAKVTKAKVGRKVKLACRGKGARRVCR